MKAKKVIGMLIAILILATAICTVYTTATAVEANGQNGSKAASSYVLGITNVRKSGGAYGIGGLKGGMPSKKVWKIVSYDDNGINYNNAFYCIKAEHGFGDFTTATNVSDRKTYDVKLDMKTQSADVIAKLNAINTAINKKQLTQQDYNKMMWIIDNMYVANTEGSEQTKLALMNAAKIPETYEYYGVLLTDDDIEVIQQLALWYFTNQDDETYHKNNTDGTPKLPELLFNNLTGQDKDYKNFAGWFDNSLQQILDGTMRQYQAEDLYKYLIMNAKADYQGEATTSPITLDKANVTVTKEGNNNIVGPFEIKVTANRNYDISLLQIVDQNGTPITLTGNNKLLKEVNGTKQVVESGNISEVIGQKFYISLPTSAKITNVKFSIKATYNVTYANYYTSSQQSTWLNEQPVVLVEKQPLNYEDEVAVEMPKPGTFDLSLRKFITKVGTTSITDRVPNPDLTDLKTGVAQTANYKHTKAPVSVKVGEIVTYTIRVYNEGQVDGYVEEITDHLPKELDFLENDEENLANGWHWDENDTTLRTIKTNHLSKAIDEEENLIKAFDGNNLSFKEVTVRCMVNENAVSGQKITNIADITAFMDVEGNTNLDVDEDGNLKLIDRDSQANNVNLPLDEQLPDYIGKDTNRPTSPDSDYYYEGQQDDDDFEKIQIQVFDLALRKFITAVENESITNRIPVPTMGEDGNIKYIHTKVPVEVQTNNIVTYTLRIFNEGDVAGYAKEITDNLPEGLLFLPDNDLNKIYRWKMIDENGNETEDVTKAVKVTTDYLSKEQEKPGTSNLINAFNKQLGITNANPDYKDIKIAFKVIEPNTSNRILTNIAQISDDSDENGNDIDSTPGNNVLTEDDIDIEHVKLVYFDLALRKFITGVNNESVTNRIPTVTMGEDGKLKYTHTKEPVSVANSDIVTYTLRIYNEGTMDGYAAEITDNLPEGLLYLPDNDLNKEYRWKMIDAAGNETNDVTKAVKITTDYLSKQQEKSEGLNLIKAFNKDASISDSNPDYRDLKVAFKVTEPNTSDRILINTAEISEDTNKNGNPVDDIDSTPGNNKADEDDIDIEKVKLKYFDLALRKFITKVDNLDINNRVPVVTIGEDGKLKYTHTKEPVDVENGNIVIYTLRVYNEGEVAGYAAEITDNLPEGLLYIPDNDLNKEYRWKMIDKDGNETNEVTEAVKITTDYLSKEQEKSEGKNLIKPFDKEANISDANPDYRDVKVAFKVTEPNTSDRILINTAEISEDEDKNGNPVDDIDSTPNNNKAGEDDIDIEKVKVKYFDLALKKWVSQVIITENGKQTVTSTGHTGDENPEPVVKVDLKDKKLNKVTVKFGYKIKVTNEGQIEGYVKELKDYIPAGLKFVASDNPDWKQISDNVVATTKLENTLLKPGESASVDIILTWINGDNNLGKKVNIAEISKDYNDSHTPDIDSTPDNFKAGEDDIDDAPVILSVKTGEVAIYFTLGTIILVTLAVGIILIKRYVL